MDWEGPFKCYCSCGWVSMEFDYPSAAQHAGESHLPHCSFYRIAKATLQNEIKKKERMEEDGKKRLFLESPR